MTNIFERRPVGVGIAIFRLQLILFSFRTLKTDRFNNAFVVFGKTVVYKQKLDILQKKNQCIRKRIVFTLFFITFRWFFSLQKSLLLAAGFFFNCDNNGGNVIIASADGGD